MTDQRTGGTARCACHTVPFLGLYEHETGCQNFRAAAPSERCFDLLCSAHDGETCARCYTDPAECPDRNGDAS